MTPSVDDVNIKDVTPRTRKHWAAKVKVFETSYPCPTKDKNKKFQRLVLMDKEGTKVQASIFGTDIPLFDDDIKLLHEYSIRKVVVQPIEPKFKIVEHNYQWIINSQTTVSNVAHDKYSCIPTPMSFINFNELHQYKNTKLDVDVLAVVVGCFPQKLVEKEAGQQVSAQEFIIVDQELKPILLTMWDHFVPNEVEYIANHVNEWPIIWAKRLKVATHNGISLSTRSSSTFLINTDIPQVITLRSWVLQNEEVLKDIMVKQLYLSSATTSTPSNSSRPLQIVDIPEYPDEGQLFKIEATASIVDLEQNFWYMSCNLCQRAVTGKYGAPVNCSRCKKQVVATPSCRIEIQLEDQSGSITAVIFGPKAEKLFSVDAITLMEHTNEDGILDQKYFLNSSPSEEHVFTVKASQRQYRGETTIKFSIISVYKKAAAT